MPFNIGVSVVGDIAIGVWFGHHNLGQRIHGRPSLSYAFHTAFLSAETMRVSLPSLDISNKRLFPASKATNFFMDVTLEDTDAPPTAECASGLTCYTTNITLCLQRCAVLALAHSIHPTCTNETCLGKCRQPLGEQLRVGSQARQCLLLRGSVLLMLCDCRMAGQIEEGDLVRLRSKWQETMGKIHGASPTPPRIAPE